MNTYQQFVDRIVGNTGGSLALFLPELVVCGTILLMLALRVSDTLGRIPSWLVALTGTVIALAFGLPWQYLSHSGGQQPTELFSGMLVYDNFTIFFRAVLLFFGVLFILFTRISGVPDQADGADFYTLSLGATLGMMLMASANHLMTIFLAVEMASVPSYVLAGMLKGRRVSSEAALKYSVYGAGAAGVMLYGISLLAGVLGSCHLPTMAAALANMLAPTAHAGADAAATVMTNPNWMVLVLGGLMIMVGLAFKLSAVPFHFWCPDVFEGATAEVNAFLSVASKAAALALLVRVAIGFGTAPDREQAYTPSPVSKVQNLSGEDIDDWQEEESLFHQTDEEQSKAGPPNRPMKGADAYTSLAPARTFMLYVITVIAAITCTFGNLAAYGQTNIKRLLAYSTIGHAGYMMMPVAAGLALMNANDGTGANAALSTLLVYVAIYLFMNLGAFVVVALVRNHARSEEIAGYAGLIRTAPGLAVCFSVILFSLIGIPPLAGFLGKFLIFKALVDANSAPMLALLVIGGLNTAVALVYYLRVIKVMTIDAPPEDRPPTEFSLVSIPGAYLMAVTLPLVLLLFDSSTLITWAQNACRQLVP